VPPAGSWWRVAALCGAETGVRQMATKKKGKKKKGGKKKK